MPPVVQQEARALHGIDTRVCHQNTQHLPHLRTSLARRANRAKRCPKQLLRSREESEEVRGRPAKPFTRALVQTYSNGSAGRERAPILEFFEWRQSKTNDPATGEH